MIPALVFLLYSESRPETSLLCLFFSDRCCGHSIGEAQLKKGACHDGR